LNPILENRDQIKRAKKMTKLNKQNQKRDQN